MTHYDKGFALFQAGDYDGAIAELVTAISYVPKAEFFYNISKAYEKKTDFKNARNYLERFAGMAPKGEKADVARRIAELAEREAEFLRSGQLTIRVDATDAVIRIDGKDVGKSPLGTLRVAVGGHHVTIEAPGFRPFMRDIVVVAGKESVIDAVLVRHVPKGTLVVEVTMKGATVVVDGVCVGTGPIVYRDVLDAGLHTLAVTRAGYEAFSVTVRVTEGLETRLAPVLHVDPRAPPPSPESDSK